MSKKTIALDELQAAIRRIERGEVEFGKQVVKTGYQPLDAHLPGGGLMRAACHEIGGAAAAGFAAGIAGRSLLMGGTLFWCQNDAGLHRDGRLYGPGLARFGIEAPRCLHIRTPNQQALLWAVEEIARSKAAACVVAETTSLDLLSSRRLQLAAEAGGGIVLLLRHGPRKLDPIAAVTRFEVSPALVMPPNSHTTLSGSHLSSRACALWRVELWRAKGASPGIWDVIWQKGEDSALSLVTTPGFFIGADKAGEPPARRSLAS